MKICIVDVATANLDDIYLTIEGVNRNLVDLMPLVNVPFGNGVILPAAAGSATWDVYLDIPCVVSAVGSAAGAGTMIIMDDSGNYIKNFQASTIGQYKAGRDYLILNTASAVTPIIPRAAWLPAPILAGTASSIYGGQRYWYHSPMDMAPLNASTVDIITFDIDYGQKVQSTQAKEVRKAGEIVASQTAIQGLKS